MVASGLNELETPIRQACNLAKAIRMMSSSDEMSAEEGEGIFGVAESLVELLEYLQETRVELWRLACEKGDPAGPRSSNFHTSLHVASILEKPRISKNGTPEEREAKAAAAAAELINFGGCHRNTRTLGQPRGRPLRSSSFWRN
jgi:hypothetical protein